MLDRKTLKARAKSAFQANYWRCVVVALIMAVIIGGTGFSGKSRVEQSVNNSEAVEYVLEYDADHDGSLNNGELFAMFRGLAGRFGRGVTLAALAVVAGAFAAVATAGWLISALVIAPLDLGCKYFFTRNSDRPAELGEIGRGFAPAWWNNVLTLFLRSLFLGLWFALFIIPGFVKIYSYRLVPYIQAEHPEMSGTEAITLSRQMMDGHKWEAFVFDLSFIGWYLLAAITASIAGLFWVAPYKAAADAELYKAIRDRFV